MELIDFFDNKALCVTDPQVKRTLMDEVRARWNHYGYDSFPGPQPVSIERVHLMEVLRKEHYRVCEKSDGQRFLFVCTRYHERPYCFVVDRKQDIYVLNYNIVTSAYDGTILDGEIIQNKQTLKHEFLVYDATMVCGENVTQLPHDQRMSRVERFVSKPDKVSSFTIKPKDFYPFENFKKFVNDVVPKLPYEIDGFVFTPNNEPVMSGTHYKMFKWKEQRKNTVDFLVEPNFNKRFPQKYIMKITKGKYLKALLDNRLIVEPGHPLETAVPVVVECEYVGPNTWRALGIRTDKTIPNSYMTWTKTLLNIEENIQLKEFFFE